jgi:hypothetical protein
MKMQNRLYAFGSAYNIDRYQENLTELFKTFDLFYDPSFDDCDMRDITAREQETTLYQSC